MKNKAVVLLSGGLDSATTLYWARAEGFECHCLIFDYGQIHRRELSSALRLVKTAGCRHKLVKIRLPWKGSSLLDKSISIPRRDRSLSDKKLEHHIPSTYVPARNIIFLSFALSFAEVIGAKNIFIGAHIHDYSGYPDCRPDFLRDFNLAALRGTKSGVENKPIRVVAPLENKSKAQIIRLGQRLKVPFGLTWSCYKGEKFPCGECDSCEFRALGFRRAGLRDPLMKK